MCKTMRYELKELLFQNKTTRQTMAKNVFWLSIGQFGSRCIRAAITIYAARTLGVSEYGIFSYALGAASFYMIFSDFGMSGILSREVARQQEDEKKYFATLFVIKIILLVFTALLLVVVAPLFVKIEKAALLMPLMALLVIFDGLREFAYGFFKGKEKMEWEAIITFTVNVAVTAFGFVALYFSPTSLALLNVYILSSFIGFLMTAYVLRKEYCGAIKHFSKKLIGPIAVAAWPLTVGGLAGTFMHNVDVLMLGWWCAAAEIGFYSAAQKIVGMLYIIGGLLTAAAGPALFRIVYENDKKRISLATTKTITIVLLIAMPLAAGGIILGGQIVKLIFGESYADAAPVFKVLISSLLVIYPFSILHNIIFAYNKQAKILVYSAIVALTNIVLNAALIPQYGATGAAIATVFANFLNVALIWRFVKKLNNFTILPELRKIIFAVIGMTIIAILLQHVGIIVIGNIIISGIFYFFFLYMFKEKNFRELLVLTKI